MSVERELLADPYDTLGPPSPIYSSLGEHVRHNESSYMNSGHARSMVGASSAQLTPPRWRYIEQTGLCICCFLVNFHDEAVKWLCSVSRLPETWYLGLVDVLQAFDLLRCCGDWNGFPGLQRR
jgi:hypothetical protein